MLALFRSMRDFAGALRSRYRNKVGPDFANYLKSTDFEKVLTRRFDTIATVESETGVYLGGKTRSATPPADYPFEQCVGAPTQKGETT
jgi:hypothetical protein